MEKAITRQRIMMTVTDRRIQTENRDNNALLLYVLNGEISITIEGTTHCLSANDMALVNPAQAYSFQAKEPPLLAIVPILYELISYSACGFRVYFKRNPKSRELQHLLSDLLVASDANPDNQKIYSYEAAYYRLLQHLLDHCLDQETLALHDKDDERLSRIMEYIQLNYDCPISLSELADELFLSTGHLSRYFVKKFGIPFSEYLMKVRLQHVRDEIIYTDKPITQISYDCGFPSISLFNRSFKKQYGLTPSAFREKEQKLSPESDAAQDETAQINRLVKNYIEEHAGLEDTLHFCIDVSKEGTEYRPRFFIVNVGHASNLRSSVLQDHLRVLKETSGFVHVRMWGLFSPDILLQDEGTGKLNFSRIDRIIDFLLQSHLKPYFDLEEKPERINQDLYRRIRFKETPVLFDRRESWERAFFRLISHLVERYGSEEMENWKIEAGHFRYYNSSLDDESYYFEFFDYVHRTVKAYVPGLEVGGSIASEFFTASEKPDLFLNHWMMRERKPDFLCIISFAYETSQEDWLHYTGRSKEETAICLFADELRKKLAWAGFPSDRLVLSEWNISVSERNLINDTAFKGAWIVRNLLELYGSVYGMGYFIASDQIMEHFDSPELLFGGSGLITKERILKPSGYAFMFMKELYPRILEVNDRFILSTNGGGRYRMVCHNLVMPNYRYYMAEEDKLEPSRVNECFDHADPLHISLQLTGVVPGRYRLRTRKVSPSSGSVLHTWKEFGFLKTLSFNDIEYIRRDTYPSMILSEVSSKEDILLIDLVMESNEFLLLQVDAVR